MAFLKGSQKEPYFGMKGGAPFLSKSCFQNVANSLFTEQVACATDMSLFGYDQGLLSGVVVTEDFLVVHDLVGTSKTKTLSTVTAIYDVGCSFGALVAFDIGERLGRKKSILLGTTLMAICTLLKCTSYSLLQIFVGRVTLGFGNGIDTSTAPIWKTETSSPKWRGKLVFLEMVMNILGFSFMFIFVLFATVPWLPESPRYVKGYEKEAIEILSCIEDKRIDDPYVVAQKNEFEYTIYYERENAIRWRDILLRRKTDSTDSKSLRRLILGAGTQFMQQFEGINIMPYYLPTVLMRFVGLSDSMARLLTAVNSVTYLIYTCCAVGLIERMGRRGLMMLFTAGQFFAFLNITILLRYAEANAGTVEGQRFGFASIVFFSLFYIFFGLERNSLQMRNKGAAVATITPIGIENIGWKFWIVWTVFNAAFLPVIYFFYPERDFVLANRTLEDIDAYYRSNPSLIVIKDPDAISVKRPLKYIEREDHEMKKIEHSF
ncbi:putative transporter [Aspergillus oryzae 100-8]|uniref:Putative transporter n=1 Tax=Aspergillus oryzae (strain 3.042) TaxID=1160506 RepID=I7ZNH0_ASPO3|nr:putative transporter [Aspergillus oryzae 3.042]KDE78951.1 putative transporter [Aspergillus oryzae 100-8]|eukprot:EIT73494.1 putative transporter [Aspergillus oryzae 3.042]